MARRRINDTTATVVQTGRISKAIIQVFTGFTGTLTVEDSDGTTSETLGVRTNPAANERYEVWDLKNGLRVTCSAAGDVLVCTDSSRIK